MSYAAFRPPPNVEWMNEWIIEWTKDFTEPWMNERTNEWIINTLGPGAEIQGEWGNISPPLFDKGEDGL